MPAPARPREVTVITGDPSLPDASKPDGRYHDEDLDCLARMRAALATLSGYRFRFVDRHADLVDTLRADPPALVLNLCDTGFRNDARFELHVAALLDLLAVPYTGAPPACMATCYDKAIVRSAAAALGVPVPDERYVDPADPTVVIDDLPALIKPNLGDGSLGITKDAVVRDAAAAATYLRWLTTELPGRAALVQEYLPGREISVGAIGNPDTGLDILPVLEVDYRDLPAGLAPILSYESKSMPASPYWTEIKFHPAVVDDATREALHTYVHALFRRLGLRDYARIDFRADAAGRLKLLEVNPNPAWGWDGKLAHMTAMAGRPYADLLHRILMAAERRYASAAPERRAEQ